MNPAGERTAVSALASLRQRLRPRDLPGPIGRGLALAGIGFAADGGRAEQRWHQALAVLAGCVRPVGDAAQPILTEGGDYPGSWIESTGTISTEVLDRFAPKVSRHTHRQFARWRRADGLMPYKLTDGGPGYAQIQIVTPLARSVWKHYRLTGASMAYLRTMYDAMAAMDGWLATHRDTGGSGGVEAFCTFDTGHDLSPRFWYAPDRCLGGNAASFDPSYPDLPYIAPDLTANVACQRQYLGLIAAELGQDPTPWRHASQSSSTALWSQCFDQADEFFYDRGADGRLHRVQSDVLARVLACEVGDEAFFARALQGYLMSTAKFLSPAGWTSLALDDPRFDRDYQRNSWGGPVNFLTLLRAPEAFERHGHVAELATVERSVLAAVLASDRFPQCLDPWSGAPGFGDDYSPASLWLLDAIERNCGVQPRPNGQIWLTGLPPTRLDHGQSVSRTGYARVIAGVRYELVADDDWVTVYADTHPWLSFPTGWRVVVESGRPRMVVGLRPGSTSGQLRADDMSWSLDLPANHTAELAEAGRWTVRPLDYIGPH